MSTDHSAHDEAPISQWALWFGMLGGAGSWALHLVYSYALVPPACTAGLGFMLYLGIPVFLGVTLLAGFFAWRGWMLSRSLTFNSDAQYEVMKRVRFMAISGLFLTAFFLMVIGAQSVPIILQDPCEAAGSIRI